jgi:hypothetical protein
MLATALQSMEQESRWRRDAYEFVTDRPAIDLLTGGPEFRLAVDGGASIEETLRAEEQGAAEFDEQRRASWLYEK